MVQVSSPKILQDFLVIFLIAKFDEIGLWMIATLLATLQKWKNAMDVNGCITQWFFWTNFVIFQQNNLGKYQKNGIFSVNLTNFA